MYKVILYYKFSPIADPEQFCRAHKEKCLELDLKGRVLIATEGINGTLAGTVDNIDLYKHYLRGLAGFADVEFKEDAAQEVLFARLMVKTRPEIVAMRASVAGLPTGADYLSPAEWKEMLESQDEFVLLDVRNNYETCIGHFEGAVTPDVENFYDFPAWLEESGIAKDKKVLMYCTGGIRCEKLSIHMKNAGYKNLFQLHGGIIKYSQEEGGKHFVGKCFVFDDRMAVPVDPQRPEPISRCEISGVPCDTYLNCANPKCNRLFICSPESAIAMDGCCSEDCRQVEFRRPLDRRHIYKPFRKWYHYWKEKKHMVNGV